MSVAENSKFVALVADNGSEFVAEQKANFTINPDIGFVKGRDCYLSFDLLNTDTNSRVASLPPTAGASAVIERMDIYSLSNGQLLESLTNYNLWASLENQYLEEDDKHIQVKQGTDANCRAYNATTSSTTKLNTISANGSAGMPRSCYDLGALAISQISSGADIVLATQDDTNATQDSEMGAKKFSSRKYCIPLKSGIFSHFGVSEKLTPILLFGGLKLEITFAENQKVLQHIFSGNGISGTNVPVQADDFARGIDVASVGGTGNRVITLSNDIDEVASLGIAVGSKMYVRGTGGATANTDIAFVVAGLHRGSNAAGAGVNVKNKKVVINTDANIGAVTTALKIWFQPSSPSYKLKNVELKVLQVVPPPAMLKSIVKESQYDFISWDCFLDNLPETSRTHQSEITSVASAAKCIFTNYIKVAGALGENDAYAPNYYLGQPPHNTFLNSVQYFINNKLYPLKPYNPQAKNDKVVNYNEVVKAFTSIGLNVKRLGDGRGGNLSDYTNTYLHARELARGEQFVYNLKDAEPQIRLGFSQERTAASTAPNGGASVSNCRMVNWVFSVKSIMVNKDNLQLVL